MYLAGSLVLIIAEWLYVWLHVQPQTDPISLHYTIAFGIDRIGPWYMAFLIPASGTALLVTNTVVAASLVERQPFTANFTLALTVFLNLILFASAMLIFRNV